MCFVAKSAPTVSSVNRNARAGTSKPVSLHRLGTRKVAQSGCARVQKQLCTQGQSSLMSFIQSLGEFRVSLVPGPHESRCMLTRKNYGFTPNLDCN